MIKFNLFKEIQKLIIVSIGAFFLAASLNFFFLFLRMFSQVALPELLSY